MSVKQRSKDKSLLSRQEINTRRKALTQKKMTSTGTGRQAIAGVVILAASVLSFLSVATFDARDRLGPGFKNAIGPVGHAIAEGLRGLFGICAFVLPIVGFYAAGILFVGDKEKKRWPQVIAFSLLMVATATLAQLMFKEDASWAHAPGGLIGRSLAGVMTALFSTVGTVVLVSAIAAVAFIVGTQFAFLRFCAFVWEKAQVFGAFAKAKGLEFLEAQKKKHEARKVAAEKTREEEAAFLAELEEEEAELNELEQAAAEAEAAAEEAARAAMSDEERRAAEIVDAEKKKLEKERLAVERQAQLLAKEALKTARAQEKQNRAASVAAVAPVLMNELHQKPANEEAPRALNGDPVWAMNFGPPTPPAESVPPPTAATVAAATAKNSQPPPRRLPNIVQPMSALNAPLHMHQGPDVAEGVNLAAAATDTATGPELLDSADFMSMPPTPAGALATAAGAATAVAAGATALARGPLIVEPKAPPKPTAKKPVEQFLFNGDRTSFALPSVESLEMKHKERPALDKASFLSTAEKLTAKLKDFQIDGEVVEIRPGPVVTMYEFKPAPGVKVSKIASLSDDLAMAMEAMRVRIVAPIPGKGVVGIEVPNKDRETVFLKEIAEQDAFQKSASRLTMCLGKDIEGMPYVLDLAKAPHLLMAGTTGSGKSVAVNSMIMSILLKSTPEEVRFIMIDPKMVELSVYEGIPHLLLPVVTDPRKAATALQWGVEEMTRRYKLLSEVGCRNITGYNAMVDAAHAKKRASQQTVEAKPSVIKPKELKEAPVEAVAEKPVEAKPAETAGQPPKKKRKLLIVDVAEAPEAGAEAAAAPAEQTGSADASSIGVASPTDLLEDPRQEISAQVAAEVQAVAMEAEIRVAEAELAASETAEEQAALSEAGEPVAAEVPPDADLKKLPYIVIVIDELADLMMVASKEVETSIARLAQMARAVGMHLMVATQRPSTDVVTGIIKANFPTRISFMLRSKPDSMTILGTVGAEALLGMGDMLIMPPTSAHLQRVHGAFVSETEIKRVVDMLKAQGKPVFDESILKPRDEENEGGEGAAEDDLSDELYDQALAIVAEMKTVSISILQRKMRIGYNRSARMIEKMERDGVVGAADGAKPRQVLISGLGQSPGAGAM